MVKMIMHGCCGTMGRAITAIVSETEGIEIAAGVDARPQQGMPYPVYASLEEIREDYDVIVDFSAAAAVDHLLDFCAERKAALVLCTTGLSEAQVARAKEISAVTPVLRSANMSLGVNLLLKLLKEAAQTLGEAGYDIEIVEKHHNKKVDAPSGTALALADAVNEALDEKYHYVTERASRRARREKTEIGISSVRGGTLCGEHDVMFLGTDEVVSFRHEAHSKAVFGRGAVSAALFLAGQKPGLYDMSDVIG